MCSCRLSNFSLFDKLCYLSPSSHNNSLLSDCILFFPSPFSVHFCSHSILVMLHYSTFMRSGFQVCSDANVFSCAVGQRLSFGFTWTGQWYIKVSELLFQGFFEELTFTWGINEAGPATRMRKSKGELGILGSEKWYVQRFREFISVQSLSCVQLCDPWTTNTRPPVHHQLPEFIKLMYIELVIPFNHRILCHPLLLLPSMFPSIRIFLNKSVLHIRRPTYWSFNFNISPSSEYSGLISFRMDWLGLLAVQGTLKSLLQHHSAKASILRCSAFFRVQLSSPYMTTGKTIALSRWMFVGKIMSFLIYCLGWS